MDSKEKEKNQLVDGAVQAPEVDTTPVETTAEAPTEETTHATAVENSTEEVPVTTPETNELESNKEEEVTAEDSKETAENSPESPLLVEDQKFETRSEILLFMERIFQSGQVMSRIQLERIKKIYMKINQAKLEEDRAKHLAEGKSAESFLPVPDVVDERIDELTAIFKKRREENNKEINEQKESNLARKIEIINRLETIVTTDDDINKYYNEVKKLQEEWNELKLIPAQKVTELWKKYHEQIEKFYDRLRINHEYREYDFKKNLVTKTKLCEVAEKLAEEEDILSAFHQLQQLHQEYRETGPVAKDDRETLWKRFKDASVLINRRHQQFHEEQREQENENLDAKTVICEIVEQIDADSLNSFKEWEKAANEVIALQKKWKTIGFVPQKHNTKIYERFRKACDNFFQKKQECFKQLKSTQSDNLAKKQALADEAVSLKDSTEWQATASRLSEMQKEWRTIGPIPRKHNDRVWKQFIEACDYFFEQKKEKAPKSKSDQERANMHNKRAVIQSLRDLLNKEEGTERTEAVRELQEKWDEIGHVPFKDKDRIYKQYHEVLDELQGRSNSFAGRGSRSGKRQSFTPGGERGRIMKLIEQKRNEILTYENNLGFLSEGSNNKKATANPLLIQIQENVDKLKEELADLQDKLATLSAE